MILVILLINLLTLPSVHNAPKRDENAHKRMQGTSYTQSEINMGHAMANALDNLMMPTAWIPRPAPGMTWAPGNIPTPAPGMTFAPFKIPTPAPGMTYAPLSIPTPAPGRTYAPGTGWGSQVYQIKTSQFLDVVIVLDSSGSVGADAFDKAKIAAKAIVRYISMRAPISATKSRVGLIEFSSTSLTNVAFHLGDYNTLWSDLDAINRINYDSGSATATAIALREAKREIDRNGIKTNAKLVWVITDGMSNEGGDPIAAANHLKDAGIKVCATGVGSSINHAEIDGMASQNCRFYPTSFNEFVKAAEFACAKANCTKDIDFSGVFTGK